MIATGKWHGLLSGKVVSTMKVMARKILLQFSILKFTFLLFLISGISQVVVYGEQFPYYKELPQPRRIYEDIKDGDALRTKAKQSAAFRLLSIMVSRHSFARGEYEKYNTIEAYFVKQYLHEESKIKAETERKLGAESAKMSEWLRLQNDLTFSSALEAELFRRYFSKQSELQYRQIMAASLVAGKKIAEENAVRQQTEAAAYQRKRELNRFTKQINTFWFIVYPLLFLSIFIIIRRAIVRKGNIALSENDPDLLIAGTRLYKATMITGELLTNKEKQRTSYSGNIAISTLNTQHVHIRPLKGDKLIEEQFHNIGVDLVPGMTISYVLAKYKNYNYLVYFKKHETNHEYYFQNASELYGAKRRDTLAWLFLFSVAYLVGIPFVTAIEYKTLWLSYFAAIILFSIFLFAMRSSGRKKLTNAYINNVVSKWRERADREYEEYRLLEYIRPQD